VDEKNTSTCRKGGEVKRLQTLLFEYSGFLIVGTVIALIWANVDALLGNHSYHHLVELELVPSDGHHEGGHHVWNVHFLINGVFMAFFFALAGKEVWESLLPGGSLSNPRQAAMPLLATVGGMAGPALLFVGGAAVLGVHHLMRGWAIPCATDIAFSYLVARIVFGARHPAIPFLLLLAIADDAAGLIILATCYPSGDLHILEFVLFVGAGIGVGLTLRRFKVRSWLPYIFGAGALSWYGFYVGGIEPALGLVPVIPTLPHAKTDLGMFMIEELKLRDTLNRMEHDIKPYVELILGLFGLANAGVVLGNAGVATGLVAFGLLVGKPLGITLFASMGRLFGLSLPEGMDFRALLTVGMAAGIGFTVALFVSTVAYRPGTEGISAGDLDAAKMGALLSFAAFFLTYILAKVLRVQKSPS
jgi:NhaA family Na+:H+ antiporter